jgi:NAD(P)-dependent dehydrogenase (short-subunit alcohol dehydrogenase family)
MPRYDVRGKVALITGGARGIGLGTARALRARGASVALVDLDPQATAAAARELGGDTIGLGADVTDRQAIQAAVDATVERFAAIDVVVANAGIAPTGSTTRAMPADEFERVVEVDLLGVYRTVRASFDQIVHRRGQAVLVSSIYAFMNGIMLSPYAVAKAGVEQLGRTLRVELALHGASATVAYFGFVDTEMVRKGFEERQRQRGGPPNELMPEFVRRPITPGEAGEAVAAAIEQRRARVIAPRWWAAPSVLRGALGPLMDAAGSRSSRVRDEVRQTEASQGS